MRKIFSILMSTGLCLILFSVVKGELDQTSDGVTTTDLDAGDPWTCESDADCAFASLTQFMSLQQIENHLQNLSKSSDSYSLSNLGQTSNNNNIWMIKINCTTCEKSKSKKVVWIDAGLRGCDWTSIAVVTNLITRLVDRTDGWEFNVVPVANPDGYQFSWDNKEVNRTWKKNRKTWEETSCVGVDLTRNFNHSWSLNTGDDPTNPCSPDFKGPDKASELETNAIVNEMQKIKAENENETDVNVEFYLYFSFRSSDKPALLYPYSNSTLTAATEDLMKKTIDPFVDALDEIKGTTFTVGQYAKVMNISAGSSLDYAYDKIKIMNAYVVNLSPDECNTDTANETMINKAVTEVWTGMEAVLSEGSVAGSSSSVIALLMSLLLMVTVWYHPY